MTEVCKRAGVDAQKLFAGIAQQAIKDQLKANTDEVMARGGFGSPTIFIDKTDMYSMWRCYLYTLTDFRVC